MLVGREQVRPQCQTKALEGEEATSALQVEGYRGVVLRVLPKRKLLTVM